VHEVPFNPNGHQMWDGKLIACINSWIVLSELKHFPY
jgi:hypothetical protein